MFLISFLELFAANAANHDYFPDAYSLNDLKLNVDTLSSFINTTPTTFNLYIENMDLLGNIYISGTDRTGNFTYGTNKRTIYLNDGDTISIHLLQPAVNATLFLNDLAIMLATNQQNNSVFVTL